MEEEALARMKKYLEETADEFKRQLELWEDAPEPKCNICGRVIYCGVDTLCKENPCGLKGTKNE